MFLQCLFRSSMFHVKHVDLNEQCGFKSVCKILWDMELDRAAKAWVYVNEGLTYGELCWQIWRARQKKYYSSWQAVYDWTFDWLQKFVDCTFIFKITTPNNLPISPSVHDKKSQRTSMCTLFLYTLEEIFYTIGILFMERCY